MSTTPLRIALVNDYEIIVAGIREMLAPYAERVTVVDLDDDPRTIGPIDIALCDTYGQDEERLRTLREPLERMAVDKVALFTWNHTPEVAEAALADGIDGLLSKTLDAEQLVDHLERLAVGEKVICDTFNLPVDLDAGARRGHDWPGRKYNLTMREAEMISLIAQGLSNLEIAGHTRLSPNSVKSYIRSAYRKIGVTRRSQAVAWGIDHGMVSAGRRAAS
ncbi:LuxR C-terminal-related transcriptional regulator [Luteococcus sp. OSA5]|uniref:LuxR C-terminal-related transcriptional regulator n=1 Tax=Luteococcus sp. OSA5 TaxID=3401630 RepID=UPI003B437B6E